MGETMARVAPAEAREEVFAQRNQFTARLYGIGRTGSATRIMSAVKHTEAKTVHIPVNSRTGRKRSFAIIGFENNTNLERAIMRHVYLFGCKTWWSTKDNAKVLEKHLARKRETNHYKQSDTEYETEAETSKRFIKAHNYTYATQQNRSQEEKDKTRRREKQTKHNSDRKKPTQEEEPSLTSLTTVLKEITKRLSKLEETGRKGRIAYRS
jgi:RNA recognition motif-containing protein